MKPVYRFEISQRLALHLHADSHGVARLQLGIEASRSGLLAEGTSDPDLSMRRIHGLACHKVCLCGRQGNPNVTNPTCCTFDPECPSDSHPIQALRQLRLLIGSSSEALASAIPACVNCTANPLHSYMQMCAGHAPVVDALSKVSCITTLALRLRTQLQRSRDTFLKG